MGRTGDWPTGRHSLDYSVHRLTNIVCEAVSEWRAEVSEHEEMREQLDRIEVKMDLLAKALGYVISKDCEDLYHKSREWQTNVCPTCGDFKRTWHLKKIK